MLYYKALLHLLVYYITSLLMFVVNQVLLFLKQNRKNTIRIHNNFVSTILFSRILEFELVVEAFNGLLYEDVEEGPQSFHCFTNSIGIVVRDVNFGFSDTGAMYISGVRIYYYYYFQ